MAEQVLNLLSDGASPDEIITEDFPDLTLEDIRACIAFANQPTTLKFLRKERGNAGSSSNARVEALLLRERAQ